MVSRENSPTISLNTRAGALALVVFAPLNLLLHLQGPRLGPLGYVAWLGLSFGILCFCEEMGAGRPLNRAGLVLFSAAFCADTLAMLSIDPIVIARSYLLYAFALLGALMHRTQFARAVGSAGAAVGGGAIVLLVAAHLLLGATTILGFTQLFRALGEPSASPLAALAIIDSVFCGWCLLTSALLWTARLRP